MSFYVEEWFNFLKEEEGEEEVMQRNTWGTSQEPHVHQIDSYLKKHAFGFVNVLLSLRKGLLGS